VWRIERISRGGFQRNTGKIKRAISRSAKFWPPEGVFGGEGSKGDQKKGSPSATKGEAVEIAQRRNAKPWWRGFLVIGGGAGRNSLVRQPEKVSLHRAAGYAEPREKKSYLFGGTHKGAREKGRACGGPQGEKGGGSGKTKTVFVLGPTPRRRKKDQASMRQYKYRDKARILSWRRGLKLRVLLEGPPQKPRKKVFALMLRICGFLGVNI